MTTEEQNKLAHLLDQEEYRIRRQLSKVATKDPATPDGYFPKSVDFGDEITEEDTARQNVESETTIVMEHELKHMLEDILKAKERITSGTYGICSKCGTDIPLERLEALPMTPFCIKCAE